MRLYHVEQRLDTLEQEEASYQVPQFRPIPVTPPPPQPHPQPQAREEDDDDEEEEVPEEEVPEEKSNQNSTEVDLQDPIDDEEELPPSS